MGKLEKRWLEKFNQLTTTLDKFLKRFTDFEEEFKFSQGGPQARKGCDP